jgi:hypothetical protein
MTLAGAWTLAAKTRRHLALKVRTRLLWWREMVATSVNISDVCLRGAKNGCLVGFCQ